MMVKGAKRIVPKKKPAKKPVRKRKHEFTSAYVAKIAAMGAHSPHLLTLEEIKAVCASCLTQVKDKK